MKHLFIPYELAVIAKEKSFDEDCLAFYATKNHSFWKKGEFGFTEESLNKSWQVYAPLYQQIIDWLSDKHDIEIYCPNYYRSQKGYKPEFVCYINGKQLNAREELLNGIGGAVGPSLLLLPTRIEALNKAILESFKLI